MQASLTASPGAADERSSGEFYGMSVVHEIVLPEAEPAYEWILGEAVQKMSPGRRHSLLQRVIAECLAAWAGNRGDVGTEWRFRLLPAGSLECRPLVPDVAYVSATRLAPLSDAEIEAPSVAPEIVVEIVSPGDRLDHRIEKRAVYLAAGVTVVIEVEPDARTFATYDSSGKHDVTQVGEVWTHATFAELHFDLAQIFAVLKRK